MSEPAKDTSTSGYKSPRRRQLSRRLDLTPRYRQGDFRRRKDNAAGGRLAYGPRTLAQSRGGQPRTGENPLFDQLCQYETLLAAWQALRKGRTQAARQFAGAADRISLEKFERNLEINLRRLAHELRKGSYRPGPINLFRVPKPGGGWRLVSVLTVKDRLLQRAVLNLIEPLFEPYFLECSFAYRPDRSTHTALACVESHYAAGLRWAVDADIESFFDRILRGRLVGRLAQHIPDRRMLALLELWLDHAPVQTLEPVFNPESDELSAGERPEPGQGRRNETGRKAEQDHRREGPGTEKKRQVVHLRRWLEDGLDWGIEQLEGDDPYRFASPRRSYRYYDDEGEDGAQDNYQTAYKFGYAGRPSRKEERGMVGELLRNYGTDGALWGLSAARKILKHGLPHLPGGVAWIIKSGTTFGVVGAAGATLGAAGYWALRKWRKAPTLYEVETAHFRRESLKADSDETSASFGSEMGKESEAKRPNATLRGRSDSAYYRFGFESSAERRGIAQGSILSPLFSNIYLHEFDQEITARGYKLVRFADDLVILCATQREAFQALREAESLLREMGLNFKPAKTTVSQLGEGFKFLGAEFGPDGRWKSLPGGEPGNPNGPLGTRNAAWLERARTGWLGRAIRTKPGIVQRGKHK